MKRPAGVIVTAIFAICGSLIFLAGALLELFVVLRPPQQVPLPPEAKVGLAIGLAMFAVCGVWGLATGIGLFLMRNWARISTIVFSVILALMCLTGAPMILLMPAPPNAPPEMPAIMKGVAAFYGLLGILGAVWVWYFTRAKTRDAFRGAGAIESGRPLSLSIIGWWLLISGVVALPAALLRVPLLFLGLFLTGWSAAAAMVVLGAAYCYVGYGILKLQPQARVLGIGLLLLFCVNGVLMAVMPGTTERMIEAARAMPFVPANAPITPVPSWLMVLFVPVMLIPLWFLVARKSAFAPKAA